MTNNINLQKQNGQPVVSSREIAEHFGKRHDNVVRDIENLIAGIPKIEDTPRATNLFYETEYQNEQNQQIYKEFLLTRDGFTLLAMGFTGVKALEWKLKYIDAFNDMEVALRGYKPKSTSAGEVANFVKQQDKIMVAQGSSPHMRARAFEMVVNQFGIELPTNFVEPSYEQFTLTITKV